jgi:hypothetical protein
MWIFTGLDFLLLLPSLWFLLGGASVGLFIGLHWQVIPVVALPIICIAAPVIGWKIYKRQRVAAGALIVCPLLFAGIMFTSL